MSIGTFLIVYRVYYQQRRVFRSRRSGRANQSGGSSPNKAKSLFYLLFTLNLLYFILVSPVVFATSILFRDPTAEVSYPRFKAIIYLMQYCNHSLNFIFYGSSHFDSDQKIHFLVFSGITSPPYRQTLCDWFNLLIPRLPQCCQRLFRQRSKTLPTRSTRFSTNQSKQIRIEIENHQVKSIAKVPTIIYEDETKKNTPRDEASPLTD